MLLKPGIQSDQLDWFLRTKVLPRAGRPNSAHPLDFFHLAPPAAWDIVFIKLVSGESLEAGQAHERYRFRLAEGSDVAVPSFNPASGRGVFPRTAAAIPKLQCFHWPPACHHPDQTTTHFTRSYNFVVCPRIFPDGTLTETACFTWR